MIYNYTNHLATTMLAIIYNHAGYPADEGQFLFFCRSVNPGGKGKGLLVMLSLNNERFVTLGN